MTLSHHQRLALHAISLVPLSVQQVATAIGISKFAARAIMQTLQERGLVQIHGKRNRGPAGFTFVLKQAGRALIVDAQPSAP